MRERLTLSHIAALRFFRIHLKNNNRNFLGHLSKLEVFKPIVELSLKESRRDTLVNSSCQEFFEFMRRVSPLLFSSSSIYTHGHVGKY